MKNKEGARAKRPAARQASGRKQPSAGNLSVGQLQAENESLIARIAAAELEIAKLERQRDDALNRIDWVIDSINSLAESIR